MPQTTRCRVRAAASDFSAPCAAPCHVTGWRYCALDDVIYDRRTLLFGGPVVMSITAIASALGNRHRRKEAERFAAPQWRPLGSLVVEAGSDRLVVSRGNEHGTVWLAAVVDIQVDAEGHTLDLYFESDAPFRFQGADAVHLRAALEAHGVSRARTAVLSS